jgi:hypothetical protein
MSFIQPENAAQHHVSQVQTRLQEIVDYLRENAQNLDDPKAKTLFENATQTLSGLVKDFSQFPQNNETTLQEQKSPIK